MKPKKVVGNGCTKKFKTYAVLLKRDVEGGMYILRTMSFDNGVLVDQVDNEPDIIGVQLGKAMIGLEEVSA